MRSAAPHGTLEARFGRQFDPQPVRVAQAERPCAEAYHGTFEVASLLSKEGHPRLKASLRDGKGRRLGHAGADAARRRVLEREESEKAAGVPRVVAVIEVV